MELELTKKEYQEFLNNIDNHLINLKMKMKIRDIDFSINCIDEVEKYFENINDMNSEDIKEFWAYFGEAIRHYVGGDYKLAPKSEDVALTPIIINYGYKEKWKIRQSPEVWRDKLVRKKLNTKLSENVKYLIEKYGV